MKRAALYLLAGGLSLAIPGIAFGEDDPGPVPDPVEQVGVEPVLTIRPILTLPDVPTAVDQIQSTFGLFGAIPTGVPAL